MSIGLYFIDKKPHFLLINRQTTERHKAEIRQQSHLKMLITTRDVLDNFKALWSAIVAFVTARADFGAAIASIQQQELKQTGTTTGGT